MANCVVRDWQGKETGKASIDLKVAKETTAVDLMHRAVLRQQAHSRKATPAAPGNARRGDALDAAQPPWTSAPARAPAPSSATPRTIP